MVDGLKVKDPKNPMTADFRAMVEVMPDGSIPVKTVAEDLGNSIIPYVEKNFRLRTDDPCLLVLLCHL